MLCDKCNTELPAGSKFCQVCGAPQVPQPQPVSTTEIPEKPRKKSPVPLICGIVAGVVLLCVLAVVVAGNTSDAQTTPETMPEPTPEVVAPAFYTVGDTAEASSYTLTIESANTAISDNMFLQPDEGYEYFEVVMTFENTTDSDLTVSSLFDFDAYLDGFAINQTYYASDATSADTIGGTMASGKKLRGSLCYEVPIGWSELEVLVSAGYGSDDEVTLIFYNDSTEPTIAIPQDLNAYASVLDNYIAAYNNGWEETDDVNYLVRYYDELGDVGYAFEDFNGDGIMEMLIAFVDYPDTVVEVYSMIDGSLERIISGGERDRYYVTDNGMFSNWGSNSASESMQTYYAIDNNGALIRTASITYFSTSSGDTEYYYFNYLSGASEPSKLSWEEVQGIEGSYQTITLTYTPLTTTYQQEMQPAWNTAISLN